MSIKIKLLYESVGITEYETIKWSDIPKVTIPNTLGVYIVEFANSYEKLMFDPNAINDWLKNSKRTTINGNKATSEIVISELNRHWKPKETILYIGQTSTSTKGLNKRLSDFYRHKPGNKGPHSGGYWIKLLSDLCNLNVHYVTCEKAYEVEFKMLLKFVMISADENDIMKIEHIGQYLPFANRTADFDKIHYIKGGIKK